MKYSNQTRILVAVDSIVFGFDGSEYKLLLIQRGFAPEKEKWSLMGGFLGALLALVMFAPAVWLSYLIEQNTNQRHQHGQAAVFF